MSTLVARVFRRTVSSPIGIGRVLALAVALLALAAPASALASNTIGAVGINDLRSDGILLPNANWNGTGDLNMIAGAGVQLYRARIELNCVDPGYTGSFNFSTPSASCYGLSYDALVGALAQRGMTLLPVLMNFSGGNPQPPTPNGAAGSPTIGEFAAFAAAAVARYGPNGTFWPTCGCTPQPISSWEIWNEENNGAWWGGTASASAYAAVFSATRTALRSVDPQARVIVGGLAFDANGQPSFITPQAMIQTLAAGNANAFDAVAVHPYTDATGATSSQLANDALALINSVAAQLVASTGPGPNGAPRQQIWVTEMGWSDQSEDPNAIAGGLADFFALLNGGARTADNIGPVLWYDLRDNSTLSTRDDYIGLRYTAPDGSDAGAKPAWNVFATAAQQQGTLTLPPALADSGPYTAPPGTSTRSGSTSGAAPGPSPSGPTAYARASDGLANAFSASVARTPAKLKRKATRLVCRSVSSGSSKHSVCVREAAGNANASQAKPKPKPKPSKAKRA